MCAGDGRSLTQGGEAMHAATRLEVCVRARACVRVCVCVCDACHGTLKRAEQQRGGQAQGKSRVYGSRQHLQQHR